MPTYFVVYTVEGNFATVNEIVDAAIHTDSPTEAPTIGELSAWVHAELTRYTLTAERAAARGRSLEPVKDAATARLIEIVTLGNVRPADRAE